MNKKWFFWAGLILGACPLLCGNTDLPKDPDIALKEIRLIPASPLLYEAPVVKVALANAGTEELPEVPLTLLWKLTKRGASRPLKEQGCSADFTKLAPGEVREITAEYIQFWPSEPGDYTLRVELALGGVLLGLEKKLENNAGTVDFTVGPGEKSDIVVTRIGFNRTQAYPGEAALNLIYVADYARMGQSSTEDKGLYAGADTGFISQNVYLYCASQGLATVVRASIDRAALAKTMKLRPEQRIVLAQTVGYPKK